MNEKQKALFDKYPQMFRRDKPTVGIGWLPLIDEACQKIEALRAQAPNICFSQVKEKFGLLNLYIDFGGNVDQAFRDQVLGIASDALMKSKNTCENCGSSDGCQTKGHGDRYWIKTLCKTCSANAEESVKKDPRAPQVPSMW